MPPPERGLALRHALALGALHGPAELLPISSSGHTTLVPWLLGWPYARLDGELRKAFEVALHAGTAAALVIALRDEVAAGLADVDRRRAALLMGSLLPPAIAGYALERTVERRLGTPASVAAGLVAGSVAMALADRLGPLARRHEDATAADGLALGLAQACALVPGASRNGMTLAAARARGFARADAHVLSRHVALPVIAGATALKALRLTRRGVPPGLRGAFAAGAGAAFASTLACARIVRSVERGGSLAPYAAYRVALAAIVLRRVHARRRWQNGAR